MNEKISHRLEKIYTDNLPDKGLISRIHNAYVFKNPQNSVEGAEQPSKIMGETFEQIIHGRRSGDRRILNYHEPLRKCELKLVLPTSLGDKTTARGQSRC